MSRWLASLRTACALVMRAAPAAAAAYLLTGLAVAGAPVASAWLMRSLVNHLLARGPAGLLAGLVAGLAACGVTTAALPRVIQYIQNELERRTGMLADDRIYQAINGLTGLSRLEDPRFLDQIRMAQEAGAGASARVPTGALSVLFDALAASGYIGVLLAVSPVLAATLTLSGIAMLIAELALARGRTAAYAEISRRQRRELFYGNLLVNASAAKEIRLFGIGHFLRDRMRTERAAADARRRRVDQRDVRVVGGLGLVSVMVSGAGLLWGVRAAQAGQLSVGDVTMFVQALAGLQASIGSLVRQIATVHENLLILAHYVTVTSTAPDLVSGESRPLPALSQGILIQDVWFRYSPADQWVLRGLTLFIPRGGVTALVGKNGSGKSTLVKLLCRFYDPDKGTIWWDGRDLRDIEPVLLRERIAAVFQDYMEYDLTLAENIAVGDISRLDDKTGIAQAAALAGVDATARELPAGYGTLLSRMFLTEEDKTDPETGVLLSGGQWQRIALARAYLRGGRDLTILDEPSSGLDAEAEYELQQGIRTQCAGRGVLLISHRLGTLTDADQIVVLKDGQIAEQGRHRDLMAAGGNYARLFDLQSRGYRLPQAPG